MFVFELFEDAQVMDCPQLTSPIPKRGPVEVCDTTATINPSPSDMARLFQRSGPLRALSEPGRFVVWPAEEALHQPVQIALRMDNRSRRYTIFGETSRSDRTTAQVGRFFAYVIDAANAVVPVKFMPAEMRAALAIVRR